MGRRHAKGQVAWKSDRLVAHGFSEVRPTATAVVVRGLDAPTHREVEITLDLQTGDVVSKA
jgi:hypothetical protein